MKHHKIKKSLWLISDNILKKGVHNQQHTESSLKQKSVHNQTLTSVLNCTCIVTNYPKIISQSKGKYLTAKDIEYYYQNDKNIYTDLVEKFNTTSYKNIDYSKADLNKRFEEIAHRIRAVDFNSRNNTRNNTHRAIKRIMNEPTISLFDNWQLISDNKKELAQINNY